MGVVYSVGEMESGLFPGPESHMQASQLLLQRVPEVPEVVTTMVHGSVADGNWNLRSDLDFLVLYDVEPIREPYVVDAVQRRIQDVEVETGVKVEYNLWPVDEPRGAREQRMYDLLYSWHLARSFENSDFLVGLEDPLTIDIANMSPTPERIREIAQNYVTYKHAGFTSRAPVFYDGSTSALSMMQRGLELPKAAGRKVAQVIGAAQGIKVGGNDFDFDVSLLDPTTRAAIDRLISINSTYTEELQELVDKPNRGRTDINAYEVFIDGIYLEIKDNGIIVTSGLSRFIDSYHG